MSNNQSIEQIFFPVKSNTEPHSFVSLASMVHNGTFDQVNSLHLAFELHVFAPIRAFAHAPMKESWDELFENKVMVDVRQPYRDNCYWRAEIICSYGYFLKLRHLGPITNGNNYFFVNCRLRSLVPTIEPEKIGEREYCAPNFIRHANIETIFNLQPNSLTIDADLYTMFKEHFTELYDKNLIYEVIDQLEPSRMICCKILSRFGDWLYVGYEMGKNIENRIYNSTWIHPKSGFFRLMGWSQLIGYPIYASNSYISLSLYTLTKWQKLVDNYLTNPEAFPFEPNVPNLFLVGSYLEFLDPFNHKMKVAMVIKKLRFGFMVIEYEDIDSAGKFTQIFQHVTSRLIFPIGFCKNHQIPLYISNNLKFDPIMMMPYKEKIESKAALKECFPLIPNTNTVFKQGMILETFNMVGRGVISYAIVDRVVDRLLALRFINQKPSLELWVEHQSPHLRPFGYTHMLELNNSSIAHPLYIDNIRFVELHLKIIQFKEDYMKYVKEEALKEETRAKQPLAQTIKLTNTPFLVKVCGANLSRVGNMIIRSANNVTQNKTDNNENNQKIIEDSNTLKMDTSERNAIKVNTEPFLKQSTKEQLNIEPMNIDQKTQEVIVINDEEEEEEEDNLIEKTIMEQNNLTNLNNDEMSPLNDSDELIGEKNLLECLIENCENEEENVSKKGRFLEFQKKVHKISSLSSPNITGLKSNPFEWDSNDVQLFLKNNLFDLYEHFPSLNSCDIDGRKFLQMDQMDFHEILSPPSLSAATWMHILKLSLIEHCKLDVEEIFYGCDELIR